MDEPPTHSMKCKKPENTMHCMTHFYEISRKGKSVEIGIRSIQLCARWLNAARSSWRAGLENSVLITVITICVSSSQSLQEMSTGDLPLNQKSQFERCRIYTRRLSSSLSHNMGIKSFMILSLKAYGTKASPAHRIYKTDREGKWSNRT